MLLYFYVEGQTDSDFITKILSSKFDNRVTINPIPYTNGGRIRRSYNKVRVNAELKTSYSLKAQGGTDVVYLRDSDFNNLQRSISQIKNEVKQVYNVEFDDIVVVIIEIESWYYAGLTQTDLDELEIPVSPNPMNVDKEYLEKVAIKRKITTNQLLLEMIEKFDENEARLNNSSFSYFMNLITSRFSAYFV